MIKSIRFCPRCKKDSDASSIIGSSYRVATPGRRPCNQNNRNEINKKEIKKTKHHDMHSKQEGLPLFPFCVANCFVASHMAISSVASSRTSLESARWARDGMGSKKERKRKKWGPLSGFLLVSFLWAIRRLRAACSLGRRAWLCCSSAYSH